MNNTRPHFIYTYSMILVFIERQKEAKKKLSHIE